MWRHSKYRFATPIHNFKLTQKLDITAIYPQSHVILKDYRFYLQIYNGQIKRMRSLYHYET